MFSARLNLCLYVCVKVQYVSISRSAVWNLQFNSHKHQIQREHNDSLWMNTNTSVSIWSPIELHSTMSAYRWLPFWWMSVSDWEALICVSRNNPCTSVLVSSFQQSLLVVCCMSQIFPDCDLRLWDLLPLEFISVLISFSPHHCDGCEQLKILSLPCWRVGPLNKNRII